MPLHHYLPATYLAEFSQNKNISPRDRRIFVGDKKSKKIFARRVGDAACINNLYTIVQLGEHSQTLEQLWAEYEKTLSKAIIQLRERQVDAITWIRILVPFVACMLVRGTDFGVRFRTRMEALGLAPALTEINDDNINIARITELQRLLGPVATAKWTVYNFFGFEPLIVNDFGYSLFIDPDTKDPGMAIPLSTNSVLAIVPSTSRVVAVDRGGKWAPVIRYLNAPPGSQYNFNFAQANFANRYIFGPNEKAIRGCLDKSTEGSPPFEPSLLGFDQKTVLKAFELTWYRLAVALEKPPNEVDDFNVDWSVIEQSWFPGPIFNINFNSHLFPAPIHKKNGMLKISYYDPQLNYMLESISRLEEQGKFDQVLEISDDGLAIAEDNKLQSQFLITKAGALAEMGAYNEALQVYAQAIEANPMNLNALINIGYEYTRRGDPEKALTYFNSAIEIDPTSGLAYINRGTVFLRSNQYKDAALDFKTAIRYLPKGSLKVVAYFNLGNVNIKLNKFLDAIFDFTRSLEEVKNLRGNEPLLPQSLLSAIDNNNEIIAKYSLSKSLLYLRRSIAFTFMNLFDEALEDITYAIALDIFSSEVRNVRKMILFEKNKFNLWVFLLTKDFLGGTPTRKPFYASTSG